MLRSLVVCSLGALAIAGCRAPEPAERAERPAAEPAETLETRAKTECTNPSWGYRLAYPGDWQTNSGEVVPRCSLFDPEPISVAPRTELPLDIALIVRREPVAIDAVTGEQLGHRVLSRERLALDGRLAVRLETESTGEARLPAGTRSYQYVVDQGDESLILTTYDLGALAYERKKEILDQLAATLRFTGG